MLIPVTCDHCGFAFKVHARYAGRSGVCPNAECRGEYVVPANLRSVPVADRESSPPPRSASRTAPVERRDSLRRAERATATVALQNDPPPARRRPLVGIVLATTGLVAVALLAGAIAQGLRQRGDVAVAAESKGEKGANVASATDGAGLIVEGIGFDVHVRPYLEKHCVACHDAETQSAEIDFAQYRTEASVTREPAVWKRVIGMLDVGAMPPFDHDPRPSREQSAQIVRWLDKKVFGIDCTLPRQPGRVTIRRLNRSEYDRTVRDLLGIDFEPSADFPSDEVGEGFDNIGDVLSLSPLLLEKYLAAAERIAEAAIPIPKGPASRTAKRGASGELTIERDQLRSSLEREPNDDGFHSLNMTGEVRGDFDVPASGEYELSVEAAATQAGAEPARMEFRIDGRKVRAFDVTGHHEPQTHRTQTTLKAGKLRFVAAFVNDFYDPKESNPRRRDRNLYVRSLTVRPLKIDAPATASDANAAAKSKSLVVARPGPQESVRTAATNALRPFLKRAFRRPVSDDEVGRYAGLVELAVGEGDDYVRGLQVAVQGILVSPHFLYRAELDDRPATVAAKGAGAPRPLGDYALASRLSYFLWSSMPDDELFAAAERGTLRQPDELTRQTRRMLADPKSQALVENFASQWLNLRLFDGATPDPKRFPEFTPDLRRDMRRETDLFFESLIREDRPVTDLLTGRYSYLNERLAKHYGVGGVKGPEFREVRFADQPRIGLLTQGSVLTLTSYPERTSPVIRGKWILENVLGTPPPPPPPDVPELPADAEHAGTSLRAQLEQHRKNPTCASCHDRMDPLGFGLENFDAIGRWRDRDGKSPIDAGGTLPGGQAFRGPVELAEILARRKPEFVRCLTEKLLVYALGRGPAKGDRCDVDRVAAELERNGDRFSALVLGIVHSDSFRLAGGEGAGS